MFRSPLGVRSSANMLSPQGMSALKMQQGRLSTVKSSAVSSLKAAGPAPEMRPRSPPKQRMQSPEGGPARKASFMDEEKLAAIRAALVTPPRPSAQISPRAEGVSSALGPIAQLAASLSVAVSATASTAEKFTSLAIETSDTSVQTDAADVSESGSHSSSGAGSSQAQELQQQQQEEEAHSLRAQLAAQLQRHESLLSDLSAARAELSQAVGSLAQYRARCTHLEARLADVQADLDAAGRAKEEERVAGGATVPLSPLRAQLSAALAELDSTRTAVRETLESNAMAATIAQGQHIAAVSGLKRELSAVQGALAEAVARAGQREARIRRVAAKHGLQAEDFLAGGDEAEEGSAGHVEPAQAGTGTLKRTLTERHGGSGGAGLFSVLRGAAAAGGAGGKGASPKGTMARAAAKLPAAASTLRTRTASAAHMTAPAAPSSSSLRRTASVPVGVITTPSHTAAHAAPAGSAAQPEGAFPAAEKAALKDLCAGLTMQVAALHRALAEAEARAGVAEEVAARARVHAFASAAAGGPTPMKVSAEAGLSDVPFSPLPAYPGGAAAGAGAGSSAATAGHAAPSAVESQGHGVASAVVEAVSHAVHAVLAPPPAGGGSVSEEDGGAVVVSDPATLRQALAAARAHLEHAHAAWREAEERLHSSAQERGQLISVIHALQGEVAAHAAASSALVAEQCALADVVRGATGERDAVSALNSQLMALLQEAEGKIRSLAIQRQVFRRAVKGVHATASQLVEQGSKGRGGLLARPTTAAAVISSDIAAPLAVALHSEAASTAALASGSVPPTPLPMPQPTAMHPSAMAAAYGPGTAEVAVGTSPMPPAAVVARDTSPGVEGEWRTSPTALSPARQAAPRTPYTPGGDGSRSSRVAALAGALLMSPGDAAGVQSAMESMLGGSGSRAGTSSSSREGMGSSSLREPPSPAGPLDLSGLGAQALHQQEGGSYTPEAHATAVRLYGAPSDLDAQPRHEEEGEEDAGAGLVRVMQEALVDVQGDREDSLPPVTAEDSMLITGGFTLPALPASPALAQPDAAAAAAAMTSVQQSVCDRSSTTLTAVTWSPAGSAPFTRHPAEAGASAAALLATAAASSVLASASIAAAQLREAGGIGLGLELTLGLGLAAHGPLLAKDAGQEVEQQLGAQASAQAHVPPMPASAPAPAAAAVAGVPAHLVLRRRWALAASNAPAINATGLAARRKAARAIITAAGGTVPSTLQSPPAARKAAASPAAPAFALQDAMQEELASQACGSSVLTGPDGLPDLTGAAGFWGAHVPAPSAAAVARPVSAQAAGPAPSMLKKARKGAQMSTLHTRGFTEGGKAGHGAHTRVQQQAAVPSHRGPGAASTAQVPAKTTRYGRSS